MVIIGDISSHMVTKLCSFNRMYSGGEFLGLKTTVLGDFGQFWVLIKGIPPYTLVYFLPRFVLISGGVKNPWKIGGNPPIGRIHPEVCLS